MQTDRNIDIDKGQGPVKYNNKKREKKKIAFIYTI